MAALKHPSKAWIAKNNAKHVGASLSPLKPGELSDMEERFQASAEAGKTAMTKPTSRALGEDQP